jgi:cation-transporting ATPase E
MRARNALKKLELLNAPKANKVMADGTIKMVMFDELLVGDTIHLQIGDEVPADGKIISSDGLEVDESILTGESVPINKPINSTALAACAVVAGSAKMTVTAVGLDTKMGSMTSVLKRYVPGLTPLQKSINKAITFLTYGALALASLIFVVYSLSGQDAVLTFKTITSSAVTIVPEGLLLGSSLLLAYGSIKLAQSRVLPQKLSAIEGMALLNVLCVDKTGTLTSEKIVFEKLDCFNDDEKLLTDLVGILVRETSGGSSTGGAVIKAIPAPKDYEIIDILPFSSSRKMSGVRVKINHKKYTVFTGAPEFLSLLAPLSPERKQYIDLLAGDGKRVLYVAMFDDNKTPLKDIANNSGSAAGVIILANKLRDGVQKTVSYLQRNGVSLRVISGDNPTTVQYIAAQAGIKNPDRIITGAELNDVSDESFSEVVNDTTIFARVLPEQKERIITSFKDNGHYTGMVGDGVNDALAIKTADLGVAMFAGATATRRVADIILLDNSFNSLPIGMRLGNRIMQAIEMISVLFFHKIIYVIVLLLSTLMVGMVFPFQPRHITFMNMFLVTAPTIIWTLFPPSPRRHISPKYYWKDTLLAVAPIAALSGIVVTVSYAVLTALHYGNVIGVSTTTVLIATFFGVYLVFLVPRMFDVKNTKKAQFARLIYIGVVLFVTSSSFGISFLRDFFDFTMPAWQNSWPVMLLIVATAILQWKIAGSAGQRLRDRESLITKQ